MQPYFSIVGHVKYHDGRKEDDTGRRIVMIFNMGLLVPIPRMRTQLAFLSGVVVTLLITLAFWKDCPATRFRYTSLLSPKTDINGSLQHIPCVINSDRRQVVDCRIDRTGSDDVLIPFSFIARYFEITGKIETDRKSGRGERFFNWQHSYAKLIHPKLPYETHGIFMSFDNYNVEVRDRVKCISAADGVPVSSQWSTSNEGHIYPVQVAQFGLSHYSKTISDEFPREKIIADFEDESSMEKIVVPNACSTERELSMVDQSHSWVLNFSAPALLSNVGISLPFPDSGEPYVKWRLRLSSCGSVSLHLDVQTNQRNTYELVYTCSNTTLSVEPEKGRIIYGLGWVAGRSEWISLVRDVYVDLVKGLNYGRNTKKDRLKPNILRLRIVRMELHGKGQLDDVILASSAHRDLFHKAALWLVNHQDKFGGWPVEVKRKLGNSELAPGWYSAMGQGQAMSVLARAYLQTKDPVYLQTALRAISVFSNPSEEGGVRAFFMNQSSLPWFEEYPTSPPSFVLNGFIYALLGLFDVKTITSERDGYLARKLLEEGLRSLQTLLPLFDTGSGSLYDLRHLASRGAPNLARWDYHATHVTQLMVLQSIAPNSLFADTSERWAGYMRGNRAPHN